jgi:hypothetical protein
MDNTVRIVVYGKLLAATGNARPCGGGAIPEAGESSVGAGAGTSLPTSCKHWKSGVLFSREMAQLGDEVKSVTCFAQTR